MELREYTRIIFRYLWLIVGLGIVVGVGSFIFRAQPAPQYQATTRFTISVSPSATPAIGYDPILTASQASEYIRDDFVEVIHSDLFADDVNAQLAKAGVSGVVVRKGNISGAI